MNLSQTNRLQQILLIVLVIQIALAVWVFWPQPAASQTSGPLLSDFSTDSVTSLAISDSENTLTLAKQDGQWVLPDAGNFPATEANVTTVLDNIEKVQTNRLVTQTDTSHRRLQVAPDDFNRRLELTMSNGTTHDLYVGSSAGAGATHVRLDNQPEVYLTGDLDAFSINPEAGSWIDTLYFTVPQTATTKLTLINGNGTFEFVKDGENWTLSNLAEDETFNQNAFTNMLNQVISVRMLDPIGTEAQADFGLDTPQATVTLDTADETYTLLVGAKNPEDSDNYVFKASNSPYYVRISSFIGDNLVNKTRADFLEAPEAEPTSESE
ncbi:MAG: DUF4340 domain-containing protein [Anaerolineae bacterium]|nr:DUF4340 domain-containing protein [Anaerolineae bacterium]